MLSAQTTDKMVNRVMPSFSKMFPTPEVLAKAPIEEIEHEIKTIGLFRSKAKHLKATAQILVDKYNGQVPKDKKLLMTLPGVERKLLTLFWLKAMVCQLLLLILMCHGFLKSSIL